MRLPLLPARACGACSACCELVGVDELGKAPGERCVHQHHAGGCQVYDDRPEGCRVYRCVWHYGSNLLDSDRPDLLGVMLDGARIEGTEKISKTLLVWEVEPGGFERARERLAFIVGRLGREVVVRLYDRTYRVFDGVELREPDFPVETP